MVFPHWYFFFSNFFSFHFFSISLILDLEIWDLATWLQENLYGKPITLADREMVEEKADDILSDARHSDVGFLVVGDPFG